jgi:hypothetical protein
MITPGKKIWNFFWWDSLTDRFSFWLASRYRQDTPHHWLSPCLNILSHPRSSLISPRQYSLIIFSFLTWTSSLSSTCQRLVSSSTFCPVSPLSGGTLLHSTTPCILLMRWGCTLKLPLLLEDAVMQRVGENGCGESTSSLHRVYILTSPSPQKVTLRRREFRRLTVDLERARRHSQHQRIWFHLPRAETRCSKWHRSVFYLYFVRSQPLLGWPTTTVYGGSACD